MIQRPASGTFDLEFGVLTHSGKKSFAISTSEIFQHLHKPMISASLRPALARVRGSWLACRLELRSGGFRRCSRTTWSRPLFFRYNAKAPNDVGAFWFLMGNKKAARWRLEAPCYRQSPYGKMMDGTMAKTNIERFDEMSADILAFLYESFPVHVGVLPRVAGLTEIETLSYDPVESTAVTSGERDPETDFFDATLAWLVQSGFVHHKDNGHFSNTYVLTSLGLQALKHVPKPSLGSETLGEKLSAATKSGAKEMAKEALNQVLSIGILALVKGAGG